jgi:hypothetical protein
MNIHSASLFPGLDGLARSLQIELEIRVEDAKEMWRHSQSRDLGRGSASDAGSGPGGVSVYDKRKGKDEP